MGWTGIVGLLVWNWTECVTLPTSNKLHHPVSEVEARVVLILRKEVSSFSANYPFLWRHFKAYPRWSREYFRSVDVGHGKHFELLLIPIIIYYYQKGRTIKVENYPKCWSSGDFLYLSSSIVITFRVALLFAHILLYRAYLCNKTSSSEGQNIEYQRNTKCPIDKWSWDITIFHKPRRVTPLDNGIMDNNADETHQFLIDTAINLKTPLPAGRSHAITRPQATHDAMVREEMVESRPSNSLLLLRKNTGK